MDGAADTEEAMSEQAQASRYTIERGAYYGTTDDRADRWYIRDTQSAIIDRRGAGYRTRAEAREAISEIIDMAEAWS